MSYPLKGPRYLNKTVDAILKLKREKIRSDICVKNIRRLTGVDGANRSVVVFYAKALNFLEQKGALRTINRSSPKKYAIIDEDKLKSFFKG